MAPTYDANAKRHWFKAVFGFGLASLLSDMGHEAATAALPALLVGLGAPPVALGLIEGVSDGLSSFAKLAGGWLADRPKWRKPLSVGGYLITGLANGVYAFATGWPHVLLVRSVGWFSKGIRGPARDTMLADAVTPETRGRAFGFHRAMDTVGGIVGPAIAAILVSRLATRSVFLWALLPGVLAAVSFALFVRRDVNPTPPPQAFWKSIAALPPRFRTFLSAVFLFGIGDFARTLLILRATQLLTPSMGASGAAALGMSLYVGHNVLYALFSFPVGWLADRVEPQRLLVLGYLLGALTAALAAVAIPSVPMLAVLFTVAGLTLAFEDTLEGTVTAAEVPPALRGTGYGVLATVNGVGDLLSSSLVGLLWSVFGASLAFGAAAALCLAGTLVLFTSTTSRPKEA
jgi:MFS family permease